MELLIEIYATAQDGMVYWVDERTSEASWKHPHYDKFRKMLQAAQRAAKRGVECR